MSPEPPTSSVPLVPLSRGFDGRWTVPGAIAFVVTVMGTAALAGFAGQHGYAAWRAGDDAGVTGAMPAGEQRQLFLVLQIAGQLLELVLIWWLASRWHADPQAALNLAPARLTGKHWLAAIGLLFGMKIVATVVASGVAPANPREELAPFLELVQTNAGWLMFLAVVVLAGATEELLFRGVLSRTLEATQLGFWGGAAVSSAAFAALHMQYGIGGQFVIFTIGMTLSWIRMRSGSLWPAIACHALNNAVALVAMRAIT